MPRILVIDDDEIMNDMLIQMLSEAGYEIFSAADGSRGLKMFNSQVFDLIITDIVMPEKEGLETILAIRKINKTIPVIAISGGGKIRPEGYLTMAQQFGADYAFQKPFDRGQFLGAIRECLCV